MSHFVSSNRYESFWNLKLQVLTIRVSIFCRTIRSVAERARARHAQRKKHDVHREDSFSYSIMVRRSRRLRFCGIRVSSYARAFVRILRQRRFSRWLFFPLLSFLFFRLFFKFSFSIYLFARACEDELQQRDPVWKALFEKNKSGRVAVLRADSVYRVKLNFICMVVFQFFEIGRIVV